MKWASTALVVVTAVLPSVAAAAPRGTYVEVPADKVEIRSADAPRPASHGSDIIYLNRCVGGCTVTAGNEDSRTNRSSIVSGTRTVSEFRHGDDAWDYVVRCVRDIYEPYAIEITEVDPGNVPHFEAIVAGAPREIGMDSGTGGVSPWRQCNLINNAITYSFANIYRDPQDICVTVAQETAHAFGLDHELLCSDPMTYLDGCSNKKYFQDTDASCGEFSARACNCGPGSPSTQNSHRLLLDHFGGGSPSPPRVEFVRPKPGATVGPAFAIEVTAEDNVKVERVELYVNGAKVVESSLRPFVFNAPELPNGPVQIEVRAYDNRDAPGSASISVTQAEPCSKDSCSGGKVCLAGTCVDGPNDPGGLGATCEDGAECEFGLCGELGGDKLCTAPCGAGCPGGFDCRGEDGPNPVCWPAEDKGGCATATGAGVPWHFGLAGLAALFVLGRRRRR
jgi:MYXO-CTERM domain-containing protein